jgi:TolB-like protein
LLIEITATTFPILKLPDWSVTLVTVLVLIGFPLALIFAWAFELTPEGLKKEKDVDRSQSITHVTGRKLDFTIITVLVLALGYFAYDKFSLQPESGEVFGDIGRSIAVLPFVNMSPDPDQEYFADGLSEEILNLLAKVPELKVIGRTSSFAFKGKNEDLRIIGEALNVNTLLEGSVRSSGGRVRITAQLIDVSDASHIWSETYDRTLTDIFAVQDDVAAAIIDALQIHVGAKPTRGRPTENTEAYALYLKARALLNAWEPGDAKELLLQAIELDPKFAEAYEQLAYVYWVLAGYIVKSAEGQKLMGEAAAKALAIDPDSVFAQALYQAGNTESYSFLGEIEALERVVREQPGNPAALFALIYDLAEAGYLREALRLGERYVELDPLSVTANNAWVNALYAVGRTSEASAALEVLSQLDPNGANWFHGNVNLVAKQDDIAVAYYEAELERKGLPGNWVRDLVTGARDPATGQAYLDRRIPEIIASMPEEDAYEWQLTLTMWYLFFGYLDRYFEFILDFDMTGSAWTDADDLVWIGTANRGFTAHPKYLEVAELMGIIDIWEQRGPPDFCEKVGGQWVCE